MIRKIFIAPVVLSILFVVSGCTARQTVNDQKTIVVSIMPLKYFVERIVDSTFSIKVLVPPGSSPEMFEPTPMQMTELSEAKVFFAIGFLDFEMSLEPKLKEQSGCAYVKLAKGIELIERTSIQGQQNEDVHSKHSHAFDPHIWMSAKNARIISQTIADELINLFPKYSELFKQKLANILAEIDDTDAKVQQILNQASAKAFLIYHPALGYYARDYGLTQYSIEQEGKSPSAKSVMGVIESCRQEGIKTVLSQRQFDIHNAETIAREIDGKVVRVDPLDSDWKQSMIQIAQAISGVEL